MSLRFHFDHDARSVLALLTDPDFLVERSTALGELSADCEVEGDEDETIVRMTREVRRELPSGLAKMFNPVQVMQMTETWYRDGDGWSGHYTVTVEGQPVRLSADFSLHDDDAGSLYVIDHRCRAGIPVVGRRIEAFVLKQAVAGTRDELEFTRRTLAG